MNLYEGKLILLIPHPASFYHWAEQPGLELEAGSAHSESTRRKLLRAHTLLIVNQKHASENTTHLAFTNHLSGGKHSSDHSGRQANTLGQGGRQTKFNLENDEYFQGPKRGKR